MDSPRVCFLDVYETVLSCSFEGHASELPAMASVAPEDWNREFLRLAPQVTDGRLSMAAAYAEVIDACGGAPGSALIGALVRRDQELLLESSVLCPDTIPFIDAMRQRGTQVGFISNCAENTRALLEGFGLASRAADLVLSCEVGLAKPDPRIYELALARLGAEPSTSWFIDDQPTYCEAAAKAGLDTYQIDRTGPVGVGSGRTIHSLLELLEVASD